MGDVVNLRLARKAKRREEAALQAQESRVAHGRTKAERNVTQSEKALAERTLDGHRLDSAT